MQIEIGKDYRARSGQKVRIVAKTPKSGNLDERYKYIGFGFNSGDSVSYTAEGSYYYYEQSRLDLVAPWEQPIPSKKVIVDGVVYVPQKGE